MATNRAAASAAAATAPDTSGAPALALAPAPADVATGAPAPADVATGAPAPAADVVNLDALITRVKRAPTYVIADDAPRAVFDQRTGAYVTRGAHNSTGAAALIAVEGQKMSALEIAAVSFAIMGGVWTIAELATLARAGGFADALAEACLA